jgi:THAP4-like, heme-binding beta-barrel domain
VTVPLHPPNRLGYSCTVGILVPEVEPLAFLLGVWRGAGEGEYPTVDSFTYEEELEFGNVGKPYLTYRQRTWLVQDDERVPSHMEFAFWRPRPGGLLEVISAHPNGVAEIEVGTVERPRVALRSYRLVTSESAKDVVHLERDFVVTDDVLAYEVRMEAVGQGLGPHLRAELRRRA